jgi:TonB-dependent receptor
MRTSDNLVQILPAEVITSLPNANVADALGRLPSVTLARDEGEGVYVQVRGTEPRLTNLTINGTTVPSPENNVRQVRLDALPAGLVDSVEINKTLSANMDGDGIGGSVNLRTKVASEQPTVTLNGLGGYNTILGGRENTQFDGTVGYRFLKDKRLGVLFGGSYDWNGRGIDDVEPAIDPASTPSNILYKSNTVREYRYYRTRFGFAGSTDYKINASNDIYLKGLYTDLKDFGDKWYYGPSATGAAKFYTSSKRPEYSINSATIGGHHYSPSSWINWETSFGYSSQTASAGNPKADFSWIGPKLTCGYSPAAQTNVYTPTFGSNCDGPNSPLQNAANWGFLDITTSSGKTAQLNLSASASYTKNFTIGKHRSTLEFGGKIRNGHKYQNGNEIVYDGWNAANYPMTQYLGDFSSSNYYQNAYYGGHYAPVSDFTKLQSFTESSLANFVDGYKTAQNNYPNQFSLVERISAGYVMDTMNFGKLHIVAGLRLENTNMDTLGYNVILYPKGSSICGASTTGCGFPSPAKANQSYVDPLPSIHFKYALTSESGVRLVYSRGIARPDPYQLIPYATQDDSTNPATVAIGNPALKPSHANSYDLLYEHYLRPAGLFQAGFFAKQITSPLVALQYTPTAGTYAGQLVTQTANGTNAHLYGFEISYQQRLAFLPGPFAGLGVNANYSYTASQLKALPGRTDSPALQRQTPNTWNVSPTYDRKRLSIRVGLTYNGPTIYQYAYSTAGDVTNAGPHGPAGDVYTYSHLQFDVQGSYRVYKGLSVIAYGLNITNEPFGYYTGSTYYIKQVEYYKPTIAAGFRYNMTRER